MSHMLGTLIGFAVSYVFTGVILYVALLVAGATAKTLPRLLLLTLTLTLPYVFIDAMFAGMICTVLFWCFVFYCTDADFGTAMLMVVVMNILSWVMFVFLITRGLSFLEYASEEGLLEESAEEESLDGDDADEPDEPDGRPEETGPKVAAKSATSDAPAKSKDVPTSVASSAGGVDLSGLRIVVGDTLSPQTQLGAQPPRIIGKIKNTTSKHVVILNLAYEYDTPVERGFGSILLPAMKPGESRDIAMLLEGARLPAAPGTARKSVIRTELVEMR
jgi:hypothetical protein